MLQHVCTLIHSNKEMNVHEFSINMHLFSLLKQKVSFFKHMIPQQVCSSIQYHTLPSVLIKHEQALSQC